MERININDEYSKFFKRFPGKSMLSKDGIVILKCYETVLEEISSDNIFIVTEKLEEILNILEKADK